MADCEPALGDLASTTLLFSALGQELENPFDYNQLVDQEPVGTEGQLSDPRDDLLSIANFKNRYPQRTLLPFLSFLRFQASPLFNVPVEVFRDVLTRLDRSSLVSFSKISFQAYLLANDNWIWYKLFAGKTTSLLNLLLTLKKGSWDLVEFNPATNWKDFQKQAFFTTIRVKNTSFLQLVLMEVLDKTFWHPCRTSLNHSFFSNRLPPHQSSSRPRVFQLLNALS